MKYLFSILLFVVVSFSAFGQEFDTATVVVSFGCNSSTLSPSEEAKLDAIEGVIISIEGYASMEGQASANDALSCARAHSVSSILDFQGAGMGETAQFGTSLKSNRVVVVKFLTAKKSTTSITVLPVDVVETTTGNKVDVEGYTCGQRVDYDWNDTLEEVSFTAPQALELEVLTAELPLTNSAVRAELSPITADTFYLPMPQAVRFYMKQGLSRAEAVKKVEARKPLWKPLKKGDVKRPSKAKKRLPRKTLGKNDSFMSRIFPFRGC